MIHRYSIDEEFLEVVSYINRKEEGYVYYDMRPLLYLKYSIYHSNNLKKSNVSSSSLYHLTPSSTLSLFHNSSYNLYNLCSYIISTLKIVLENEKILD